MIDVTNELERYCSSYFGSEDALFMITCSMANQITIRYNTSPGDNLLSDSFSHLVYYCSGAVADLAKSNKVLLYKWSDNIIRAVTHKDITKAEIINAASIINNIFKSCL